MENFAFMEISCRHDRQVVMNDGYTHTHCRRDGQVVVNDGIHTASLTKTDVAMGNGVLHVIDKVGACVI